MPKRSHFGLREKRDRERERGKKRKPFSSDFIGFFRSELSRPRVKAALRDKSYAWYWNHKILSRSKVRVLTKTEKKAVSREITLIEVGFLSYSV